MSAWAQRGSIPTETEFGMEFEIFIDDPTYDNDDNPYGKIKLHNYINMNNSTDYGHSLDNADYMEL